MNVEVLASWSLSRRDAAAQGSEQRAKADSAIQVEGAKKKVARRNGLELGERQPLMSGAAARMGGGGVRSLAGSAETPRPKAASNALKQARRFKLVVAVK